MKVILLSSLLILRVPDEGYSAFQSYDFERKSKDWKAE
jgi:hypothetical protein